MGSLIGEHLEAQIETDLKYPAGGDDAPATFRRKLFVIGAVVIAVPILGYVIWLFAK